MDLDNSVHIWKAVVPTSVTSCLNLLSDEEKAQSERFAFEVDRDRFIATRFMVRQVLSCYCPLAPQHLIFKRNEFGKPSIKNSIPSPVFFNVSHTFEKIVCAIASFEWIGIDIENRVPHKFHDFSKSFFSREERRWLRLSESEDEAKQRFLDIWTHKEALIKGIGKGLSIPLQDFSVSPNSDNQAAFRDEFNELSEITSWRFRSWNWDRCKFCVAYPQNESCDFVINQFNVWS